MNRRELRAFLATMYAIYQKLAGFTYSTNQHLLIQSQQQNNM